MHSSIQPAAREARARASAPRAAPTSAPAEYYARIERYAHRIRGTEDLHAIIELLQEALAATHALHSSRELAAARREVQLAERRIGQLKAELEQANELVRRDRLTGTLNRRGIEETLEREAARAERTGAPLSVALLDVDDFKEINDRCGHPAGDSVLRHVVEVLRDSLRAHDAMGRYGGEEFVVVLPDTGCHGAVAVTERLRTLLAERRITCAGRPLSVTFSAGVAQRRRGEARAALLTRADHALYEAKRAGKSRVLAAP